MSRVNQRLNGLDPLAYIGVDAYEPTDFITQSRDPLASDYNNFLLGTWWLNTATNSLFVLVSVDDASATWLNISEASGAVDTLTGDSGGAVAPTGGNINVVGDGTTITIAGNPGTNTLTVSAILSAPFETLTGDSGGAVSPTDGNINIIGSSGITVSGDPTTSTLTVNPSSINAISFVTQSGTATPSAGALTINGANGLTTTGSGNTVTVASDGSLSTSFVTSPATGTAIPNNGVITLVAGANTTITASGSTITVNNTGSSGSSPSYEIGSFTPTVVVGAAVVGYATQFGAYLKIGNIVFANTFVQTSSLSAQGNISLPVLPYTPSAAGFATSSGTLVMNNAITAPGNKYNFDWINYENTAAGQCAASNGATPLSLSSNNSGNNLSLSATGFYFLF